MATRTWEGGTSGQYDLAANWVEGSVPIAGDAVTIPATSTQAITTGLNQSAVTLASFTAEYGAPAMGIETAYLQIAASGTIRFSGSATSLLDVGGSATVQVDNTITPSSTGYSGLYLKGSGITTLLLNGGYTAFAWRAGETSSATTIRVANNATLWTGASVTNTTFHQEGGTSILWHGGTTMNINGGTVTTRSSGAWTTVNQYGGYFYPNSTGTISNGNCYGGTWDNLTCAVARTCTNFRLDPGGILRTNPAFYTISNWTSPTTSIVYTTTRSTNSSGVFI